MASTTLFVELAKIEAAYGNWVSGIRVVKTRAKAPKDVAEDTRWVMVRLDIEDPDSLFKNEQEVGAFGVVTPVIEATLEED